MGKGSKPTIGFWYHVAYHHGLTIGPIDAFLEFRGGDKTAWSGELTSSGTIHVNAPMLWGGEKDQGGIVGDLDVMFGEPTQAPNPYLVQTFGNQTAAWRGFATVAFKGGRYGAMNPYPKPPAYKFRQILQGWDAPGCWYPEKAQIVTAPGAVFTADLAFPATAAGVGPYAGVTIDSGFTATDALIVEKLPGMTYRAWSPWKTDDEPEASAPPWCNTFRVTNNTTGATTEYWPGHFGTIAEAEAAALGRYVVLTGGTSYTIWLNDTPVDDNRGGLSVKVWKGGSFAINPAHVLYDSRTNSDMGREPRANINDASLRAAADKLYDEGFGICPAWDPANESVEDFEKRICKLIGGSFTRSLEDGQWYLDLARGDYVLADLPILTDDDILDFKEQPAVLDNAVNSVSVRYFDPERKETIVTAPTRALGLVAAFGTIHQTTDYRAIPTGDLASRIAQRDVMASATPKRVFDLATMRKTYAWRPNQYFRLQAPKRGIVDMVCLVGDKQSGTLKSGAIRMKAAQDIYSLPSTGYVQVEPGVDTRPPQTPTPITAERALEAPYVEIAAMLSRADLAALPAEVGYAMAVAANPGGDIDYTMMVVDATGNYADAGRAEWCASATVVEAAGYVETAFKLADGSGLGGVVIGMGALWDDEIVRVDALDVGAGTITLGRGCADTVRQHHSAGARLWIYPTGFAYGSTEYTDGEVVDVKLLANTGSRQQDLATATAMPITFGQRQARPYPPGKMRINGVADPSSIAGVITVTGVHRDRVQQADQLVDDEMPAIGPEAGTTYTARYYLNGTLMHTDAGLAAPTSVYTPVGAGIMRVEFESSRAGLRSYQMHIREFAIGQPLLDEAGELITTEDIQIIIMG